MGKMGGEGRGVDGCMTHLSRATCPSVMDGGGGSVRRHRRSLDQWRVIGQALTPAASSTMQPAKLTGDRWRPPMTNRD